MVKPITGMLRRGLVLDLSVAFGMFARQAVPPTRLGFWIALAKKEALSEPLGAAERRVERGQQRISEADNMILQVSVPLPDTSGGYHVPAVRRRDLFYAKLEDQRAEAAGQV
ncbi:hypothetical protein Q7P37_009550 [Cladosporium fusiforme]